ncbi:WapI family immunity protein [Nocardioides sp. Iso805N]|uniref:WapI family immunity protein n=1 Tax=Nocardioides sp. Iso805N TaxID=1283287 RepID=UPI000360FADB|nr:hypothetical protein [Nocardioides sp. Iso805N]
MRLESLDGAFVDLTVIGYQFASGVSTSSGPDWDANWLMVHGEAWDGVQSWAFDDPCLTTWEAKELASWLRGLGSGGPTVAAGGGPGHGRFLLTEPNLMFALIEAAQGITTMDIYFEAESRPPMASCDDGEGAGHKVRLTIPQSDLARAGEGWEHDLEEFPPR